MTGRLVDTDGIESIEGIGLALGKRLREAGIASVQELLEATRRPAGRRSLAEATQISQAQLLRFANAADLRRIAGVVGQDVELLQRAGVDTVRELRNRNAENLAEKLEAVNKAEAHCSHTPERGQVQRWIDHAKALPLVIEV